MRIVTVEQMRAIEAEAEQRYGLTGPILMKQAGASAAEIAREWIGDGLADMNWLLLVGPGNNGGDARVMAEHLSAMGALITLYEWKTQRLTLPDSTTISLSNAEDPRLVEIIKEADCVVDAFLGIGHSRPLSDSMIAVNKLVRAVRMQQGDHPRIIALDTTSGLNANTGAVDPGTLAADITITLAAPKIGLFWFPGVAYTGEIRVGSIGLPDEMELKGMAEMIDPPLIASYLPQRPLDSNKGTYGKTLIVAGSPQFPGAALLAATAAGRSGAGLITIAAQQSQIPGYVGALPEATYVVLSNSFAKNAAMLLAAARKVDAMLIGPGLGQEDATRSWLLPLLADLRDLADDERPALIVDADGLNILSHEPEWWKLLPPRTILTPHPGEMSRLLGGRKVSGGESDRLEVAREAAARWGHIVVLKGSVTLITSPDENELPCFNYAPNPAMATAGAGDVLAGTIAGLLAQKNVPLHAAVAGVALHSEAGRRAAHALGDVTAGMLAGDIAQYIPDARAAFEGLRSTLPE
jgi:ADP-dependent NAD(P)H-hydrate dehydratase / NAD(P)H-hydrate epimerase